MYKSINNQKQANLFLIAGQEEYRQKESFKL